MGRPGHPDSVLQMPGPVRGEGEGEKGVAEVGVCSLTGGSVTRAIGGIYTGLWSQTD